MRTPEGWRRMGLGDFVSLQRGHDLPDRTRRSGRTPVIGSGGRVGWHDEAIARGPGITIGRATNLGAPTLVYEDFWPLNTTLYVTDFRGNDIRFTYYLFRFLDLTGFDSGSVQPMLNRNYIRNFPVTVPNVPEQRGIAGVLGALDDKIAINDRIGGSVDGLCAALLDESLKDGWQLVRLDDIASINELSVERRTQGTIRYIDISSVSSGRISWPEPTPWIEAPGRARRGVSDGDTIWSAVRPNRRSYALILDPVDDLVVSTGFAVISPRNVGPAYLYQVVARDEFINYLVRVVEGSAYPAVRPESFAAAEVPLLRQESLSRFETTVMPMRRRVHAAWREARVLARLRDTLLPRLMSGEIRVRDAERVVEEVG